MSAIAEAMLDAFAFNTRLTWSTEGAHVALASFSTETTDTITRFLEGESGEWQVDLEVHSGELSAVEYMTASIRAVGGVFQAIHEFLEVRQPMELIFSSEHEALGELYETYLRRPHTVLSRIGYEISAPLDSTAQTKFLIRKATP